MTDTPETVFRWIDGVPIASLFVLALACHLATSAVERFNSSYVPFFAGGALLLIYFVRCLLSDPQDYWHVIQSFLRSLVCYEVAKSIFMVLMAAFAEYRKQLKEYLETIRVSRQLAHAERSRCMAGMSEPGSPAVASAPAQPAGEPVPPPPSRSERIRSAAREANDQYEQEMELLSEMPVDADEKKVLAGRYKRKLLEELKKISEI